MKRLIFLILFLPVLSWANEKVILSHEEWSMPKTTESVLKMKAVNFVLSEFNKNRNSRLVILYPGGDEGTLWAAEFKSWLISLGIRSRNIELKPGGSQPGALELVVDVPSKPLAK